MSSILVVEDSDDLRKANGGQGSWEATGIMMGIDSAEKGDGDPGDDLRATILKSGNNKEGIGSKDGRL